MDTTLETTQRSIDSSKMDMGQVVDATDPHNPVVRSVDLTDARRMATEMPDKYVYVDIYGITTIFDEMQTDHIFKSHVYVPAQRTDDTGNKALDAFSPCPSCVEKYVFSKVGNLRDGSIAVKNAYDEAERLFRKALSAQSVDVESLRKPETGHDHYEHIHCENTYNDAYNQALDDVKALSTQSVDVHRCVYGNMDTDFPRKCMGCGEDEPLAIDVQMVKAMDSAIQALQPDVRVHDIAVLEGLKYTEDQGMDNEMENHNAGIDACIEALMNTVSKAPQQGEK